jgi:4-methyl-5(b-hydroxyethyl)-thiazole monophosphate biosynthesis
MAKVLVLLAEGFEEIEAVTCIDVLRRGEIQVTTASLGARLVRGAHALSVEADTTLDGLDTQGFDALVLPGGMPGSKHLRDDSRVIELVRRFVKAGKITAAICAAPTVLEKAGVLAGRRATSFPGEAIPSARFEESSVVEDGPIITSRAAGTAFPFALALVRRLVGVDKAEELRDVMLVPL